MISNLYTLSYVLLLKSNFVKRIYVQIHLAVLRRQLHADGGYPQRSRIMKLEDNQYVGTEEIEEKRILLANIRIRGRSARALVTSPQNSHCDRGSME